MNIFKKLIRIAYYKKRLCTDFFCIKNKLSFLLYISANSFEASKIFYFCDLEGNWSFVSSLYTFFHVLSFYTFNEPSCARCSTRQTQQIMKILQGDPNTMKQILNILNTVAKHILPVLHCVQTSKYFYFFLKSVWKNKCDSIVFKWQNGPKVTFSIIQQLLSWCSKMKIAWDVRTRFRTEKQNKQKQK